jgi:hypothetical protein
MFKQAYPTDKLTEHIRSFTSAHMLLLKNPRMWPHSLAIIISFLAINRSTNQTVTDEMRNKFGNTNGT